MKRVFVDFNELHHKELSACHPEHVDDQAPLALGEHVIMHDGDDGDTMEGIVVAFRNYGRGELVHMLPVEGTFRPGPAPAGGGDADSPAS